MLSVHQNKNHTLNPCLYEYNLYCQWQSKSLFFVCFFCVLITTFTSVPSCDVLALLTLHEILAKV